LPAFATAAEVQKMTARSALLALCAFSILALPISPAGAADNALVTYCKADIERLCAGIEPAAVAFFSA
jgi:hypothetical protein